MKQLQMLLLLLALPAHADQKLLHHYTPRDTAITGIGIGMGVYPNGDRIAVEVDFYVYKDFVLYRVLIPDQAGELWAVTKYQEEVTGQRFAEVPESSWPNDIDGITPFRENVTYTIGQNNIKPLPSDEVMKTLSSAVNYIKGNVSLQGNAIYKWMYYLAANTTDAVGNEVVTEQVPAARTDTVHDTTVILTESSKYVHFKIDKGYRIQGTIKSNGETINKISFPTMSVKPKSGDLIFIEIVPIK